MPIQKDTTDSDIRSALHSKRFNHARKQPNTLVIDELGLAHAKSRIDVAVINGSLHGYEIKSERDNLMRLQGQIATYRQTLQKITIVAASTHIDAVSSFVPEWCGVIEAQQGPRGGIQFFTARKAIANPEIDPVMVAHLLWRSEVIDLLLQIGHAPKELRRPRKHLYEMLCQSLSLGEIVNSIRASMVKRQSWRVRSSRA